MPSWVQGFDYRQVRVGHGPTLSLEVWVQGSFNRTIRTFWCGLLGHQIHTTIKANFDPPGVRSDISCSKCWLRVTKVEPITITFPPSVVTAEYGSVGMERWNEHPQRHRRGRER